MAVVLCYFAIVNSRRIAHNIHVTSATVAAVVVVVVRRHKKNTHSRKHKKCFGERKKKTTAEKQWQNRKLSASVKHKLVFRDFAVDSHFVAEQRCNTIYREESTEEKKAQRNENKHPKMRKKALANT